MNTTTVQTSVYTQRVLLPYNLVIITLGIFGNANIVIATARHVHLQMKCGYLIALLASIDSLCLCCELFLLLRPLWWPSAISISSCYFLNLPYLFLYPLEVVLVLSLAVDRLVAIKLPIMYNQWSVRGYLSFLLLMGTLLGIANLVANGVLHQHDKLEDDRECILVTSLANAVCAGWNYVNAAFGVLTAIVYHYARYAIELYGRHRAIMKHRARDRISYQGLRAQRQTIRTLSVNVHMNILLTVLSLIASNIALYLGGNEDTLLYIQLLATIPTQLSYSINFYIFLWRSTKYRKIFSDQLRCRLSVTSSVAPMQGRELSIIYRRAMD